MKTDDLGMRYGTSLSMVANGSISHWRLKDSRTNALTAGIGFWF